jgi:benzil reductase ((S)-benzoin forming)
MVILTGTSRGIGFHLANQFLKEGKKVIGIGRTNTIDHPNYQHFFCDLAHLSEVEKIVLPQTTDPVIFIHNAGSLGEVKRFSDQSTGNLATVLHLNFVAGTLLAHQLLTQRSVDQATKIAFISSGAGKRAIPSWSAYCASKAAVDLWLETIQLEEIEKGRTNFQCYAIAPGVVDTAMQAEIRATLPSDFSSLANFQQLKTTNELIDPAVVASKIRQILAFDIPCAVQWSVREVND